MSRRRSATISITLASLCMLVVAPAGAQRARIANTSHAGWPPITGMLLKNALNESRPLDGRPGHNPFDGIDPAYSCDQITRYTGCGGGTHFPLHASNPEADFVPEIVAKEHNELLGGNGSDSIHAGPGGDVIWGDFEPSGQPESQVDHLYGGPGNDWIYASHGTNYIWTGAGNDHLALVYGHGEVHCGPGHKTITMRKLAVNRDYKLIGCTNVTIVPFAA